MTVLFDARPHETRRVLPEIERQIEKDTVSAIGKHFASFSGSMREAYDALTAQTPIAENVALDLVDQPDAKGWWIRPNGAPPDRAIFFIHGGAYALGSAKAYRGFVSQIAIRAGVNAFAVDYPLAPEHPYPAAYDATVAAFHWVFAHGIEQIALVGDSAGGGLVLALLSELKAAAPAVAAAVVMSPWVDLTLSGASVHDPHLHDPILQKETLAQAADRYLAGVDSKSCRASPLFSVPHKLPPLAIQVGSDELLLDDARRYAIAAAQRGGEVRLDVFEGLHHVFQRSTNALPSARLALDVLRRSLSGIGCRLSDAIRAFRCRRRAVEDLTPA